MAESIRGAISVRDSSVARSRRFPPWRSIALLSSCCSGVFGCSSDDASAAGNVGSAGSASSGGGGSGGAVAEPASVIPACADGEATSLSYYRLRVEFTSQTDWTGLHITDPSNVIKARTISTLGAADKASAAFDQLNLNQPLDAAQQGETVSITADYALRPAALESPLSFRLEKGVAGPVDIRLSSVVGDQIEILEELSDQTSPTTFEVDLSSLSGTTAWQAPMAPVSRMAWAVYYPWYSLDSWSSEDLSDAAAVPYASESQPDTERQMREAKSAGIDGFLMSWWGPGSGTDKLMPMILDAAAKEGFKMAIFLESLRDGAPLPAEEFVAWISYFVATYRSHPALMKVDDKPVIMPWVTCMVPAATWATVFAQLRDKGLDATMIADCTEPEYFPVFDGAKGGGVDTGRDVRYYAVLADEPVAKIWMGNANPGYDDRLLDDRNGGTFVDRENGERFRRELNDAMLSNPHWMRIETWNEYFENTHVEPSRNFGDQYLRIAGEYLKPWKCSN